MERHVDYIHTNPLKHGLVSKLVDWPYSSFHEYVADSLLPNDWAGGIPDECGFGE
jgi:putative transposase